MILLNGGTTLKPVLIHCSLV